MINLQSFGNGNMRTPMVWRKYTRGVKDIYFEAEMLQNISSFEYLFTAKVYIHNNITGNLIHQQTKETRNFQEVKEWFEEELAKL